MPPPGGASGGGFMAAKRGGQGPALIREYSLDDGLALPTNNEQVDGGKLAQNEYVFVALYDFHGSGDGIQLSLRKGDQVSLQTLHNVFR